MSEPWPLPPEGDFEVIEHTWIPMADGLRLSARLWLPQSRGRVPAVLEYIPYRKRDGYRAHDDIWGPTLARHGFAYARVDVRGSGESEGVLTDEYSEAELADGEAVIAWLAARPWCSGAVGMRGISWGGINTLQIAARRPPALKAIMPMGCMDDRYTDDAHYIGGALGNTNLQWGLSFKLVMAAPPDPAIVGDAWEAMWRERLAATPDIVQTWLSHQRYDGYWKRGSIREDWSAIQVPTYIVAGWRDTYSGAIARLFERLSVPKKALIGPWGHTYPYLAQPRGLDWAHEELRWWTHWLSGVETGIMDEPVLRAFIPDAAALGSGGEGRWVTEPSWPPANKALTLQLGTAGLSETQQPSSSAKIDGRRIVGLTKPEWLNRPPLEQSFDDARSLTFDTAPLDDAREILGVPIVRLRLSADQPIAHIAARLTEVHPDGRSELVTWGVLNLTHRRSHETPKPLNPGDAFDVELLLAAVAHRFKPGSRIRLALSESLWPLVWPSPERTELTVALGESSLVLPVRPPESESAPISIPERRAPERPPKPREQPAARDADGWVRFTVESSPATTHVAAADMNVTRSRSERLAMREGEPMSCRWTHEGAQAWKRGDWNCAVEAFIDLTATAERFQLMERLTARLDGVVIFEHETSSEIDRDLM